MVEHVLAKDETGVQFSLLALHTKNLCMSSSEPKKYRGVDEILKDVTVVKNTNGEEIRYLKEKIDNKSKFRFDKNNKELTVNGEFIKGEDVFMNSSGNRTKPIFSSEELNEPISVTFHGCRIKNFNFSGFNNTVLDLNCKFDDCKFFGNMSGATGNFYFLEEDIIYENEKIQISNSKIEILDSNFKHCHFESLTLKNIEVLVSSFIGCSFNNLTLDNVSVKAMENCVVRGRISLINCEILETDLAFLTSEDAIIEIRKETKLFLPKIALEGSAIRNLLQIKSEGGPRKIYFSKESSILPSASESKDGNEKLVNETINDTYKELLRYSADKNERVQELIFHKKIMERELHLDNLDFTDKLIVRISSLFGGGIYLMKPICLLLLINLVFFLPLLLFYEINFLELILPLLPEKGFELFAGKSIIVQIINAGRYFFTMIAWYFIIRSLTKFTYRK